MSSLRHIDRPAGDPRDAYLDAARDCILDVGWRRTTLTEVAKRAGVSRMTIYRAWPDMGSLLGDLMTREWVGIAAATQVAAKDTTTPAGIAAAALATVRALRDNELFVRMTPHFEELGIDGRDYSLLAVLSNDAPGSQAELARLCSLLPAQLVPVLDAYASSPIALNAVFPQHREGFVTLRTFIGFLAERLGAAAPAGKDGAGRAR